jgi:catechol 2,3-dioxygenase-like lactoylglutathione lyase family enzyme
MERSFMDSIVDDFERGRISRRQLVARLMGVGAAMATLPGRAPGQEPDSSSAQRAEQGIAVATAAEPTFQATGLDHIALDVVDVPRSRDFYAKHLGLRVVRGNDDALFMGADRDFFLTLFRAERPQLNHYCYAIRDFSADDAVEKLGAAGLRPRRTGNRVYFPDPDGLTVQVTGRQ